jgi:hypothetical protein
MNFKKIFSPMAVMFFLFLLVPSANALTITPSTIPQWSGLQTKVPDILAYINPIIGYAPELYKQNVGGIEEGPFAAYYTTTFANTEADPQDATIVNNGPLFISGSPIYFLVKDGNQNPAWYLFETNWNGTDAVNFSGFWPKEGAISFVSIYGKVPVPEPATLILLGCGILGIAGFRKKFNKN